MKLSRHAKNNMKLYKIYERDIEQTIEFPDQSYSEGNRLTALKKFSNRFSGYPLKTVYEQTEKELFIITAYPLKKRHRR